MNEAVRRTDRWPVGEPETPASHPREREREWEEGERVGEWMR